MPPNSAPEPRSPRLTRTARAEEDLIEVWTHIARDRPAAADRVLDKIETVCERLADNPRMGPLRPDLADALRFFASGAYLMMYCEPDGGVEVVRVIHGARDLPTLFRDL